MCTVAMDTTRTNTHNYTHTIDTIRHAQGIGNDPYIPCLFLIKFPMKKKYCALATAVWTLLKLLLAMSAPCSNW